jgi:hypothetical protein
MSIPLAAQSKAWVCGLSFAGTAGSNPAGDKDICLLVMLVVVRQRSPTECGVSEYDPEASIMRKSRPE